jgi:hypothetical protein
MRQHLHHHSPVELDKLKEIGNTTATMKIRPIVRAPFCLLFALISLVVWIFQCSGAPVYVYDSFGPGNSFNTQANYAITGPAFPGGYRGHAEWFVPDISGKLSTIQLATIIAGPVGFHFSVAQDNGSGIPGTVLEDFSEILTGLPVFTLNSRTRPELEAGTRSWLCAEPAFDSTACGWFRNNQGYAEGFAYDSSHWNWTPLNDGSADAVFSVAVIPVPEPTTAALVLLGGCLIARVCRSPCKADERTRFVSLNGPRGGLEYTWDP